MIVVRLPCESAALCGCPVKATSPTREIRIAGVTSLRQRNSPNKMADGLGLPTKAETQTPPTTERVRSPIQVAPHQFTPEQEEKLHYSVALSSASLEDVKAMVAVLERKVAAQSEELSLLKMHQANSTKEEREAASMDTADEADIANLYSYCLEKLTREPNSLAETLSLVTGVSFLCLVQVIYAWGFCDSSTLISYQAYMPAFIEPFDSSMFYPKSIVPGTYVPFINAVCSIISLAYLALLAKNDSEGTLLTCCPLELICLPTPGDELRKWATPLQRALRIVLCLLLQFHWCCRTLLLPVLAGMGTSSIFTSSKRTQDIVLNSAAIAFVFELDEFFYATLLSKLQRESFEANAPRPASPLSSANRKARPIVAAHCWVLWACDLGFTTYYYAANGLIDMEAANDLPATMYWDINRTWTFARAVLLIIAQLHVTAHCGRPGSGATRTHIILGCALLAMSMLGYALASFSIAAVVLDGSFANDPMSVMYLEDTMQCLTGVTEEGCPMLHTTPGIYERLAGVYEATVSLATSNPTALDLAWGARPWYSEYW